VTRTKVRERFAVCVENEGYPASLELWKIYRVVPDPDAESHQQVRVVDESGEDYVYPRGLFCPVDLPVNLRRRYPAAAVASDSQAMPESRAPVVLKRAGFKR
jgi:hypothetical protein